MTLGSISRNIRPCKALNPQLMTPSPGKPGPWSFFLVDVPWEFSGRRVWATGCALPRNVVIRLSTHPETMNCIYQAFRSSVSESPRDRSTSILCLYVESVTFRVFALGSPKSTWGPEDFAHGLTDAGKFWGRLKTLFRSSAALVV